MSKSTRQHDASAGTDIQLPMTDVVRFIRQLSHDLRNHLNAAELQAAYLKEIVDDAEAKKEIQRLRGMVSELGENLQKLTATLAPIRLTQMPYEASAFVEDLQQKVTQQFGDKAAAFEWKVKPSTALLEIDPQLLQQAALELLTNSLTHSRGEGQISVKTAVENNRFVLTLSEPKAGFAGSTDNWGGEPFKRVKHGHYSLGLHRARNIVEAHGGTLTAHYDSGEAVLHTVVELPVAHAA